MSKPQVVVGVFVCSKLAVVVVWLASAAAAGRARHAANDQAAGS
jgi:hypothetical protein